MNILTGEIADIKTINSLSLVRMKVGAVQLYGMVIDTPQTASYLRTGNSIKVIFKETEVIVGKGTVHENSVRNKLVGSVQSIESGELLTKLLLNTLAGPIIAVIPTDAVYELQIEPGVTITAMIKANEMILSE